MHPLSRIIGVVLGTLRAEYRQLHNRYRGHIGHFNGDARDICGQTLSLLWEGDFYRTSLGHFDFFWMRDFGTVCESLVKLGNTDRVHRTLQFALRHYRRAGHVTLCIDARGNCFDAPSKSIDALPWLLHSLVVSHYPLNKSDTLFLSHQLKKFCRTYLDTTGMVRSMHFAEMRDAVIYDRSAYAVTLVAVLAQSAEQLGLHYPYSVTFYQTILLEHYWNGHYFNADYANTAFSAECALFPFFMGIINSRPMVLQTVRYIHRQRLNEPYPLIYTNTPRKFHYRRWMEAPFMPNYEGDTVWSWHGEFYLHILHHYRLPEYHTEYTKFCAFIERHGMFPELLNIDGSWYNAPIYRGDPGMVWAALFLELPKPSKHPAPSE